MIVERQDDEILIRISASRNIEEIQTLLNYLKYEELTLKNSTKKRKKDGIKMQNKDWL